MAYTFSPLLLGSDLARWSHGLPAADSPSILQAPISAQAFPCSPSHRPCLILEASLSLNHELLERRGNRRVVDTLLGLRWWFLTSVVALATEALWALGTAPDHHTCAQKPTERQSSTGIRVVDPSTVPSQSPRGQFLERGERLCSIQG